MVIVDDIFDRWVFQVLCLTDSGLGAVGVLFEKSGKEVFPYFVLVTVHVPVFLLIDCFKFGMKEAHDRIAEPFSFDGQPLIKLVRRNIIYINSLLHPGIGIGSLGSDRVQKLVVLIWHGKSCRNIGNTVYILVDRNSFVDVSGQTVLLIECRNLIELNPLLFIVQRS